MVIRERAGRNPSERRANLEEDDAQADLTAYRGRLTRLLTERDLTPSRSAVVPARVTVLARLLKSANARPAPSLVAVESSSSARSVRLAWNSVSSGSLQQLRPFLRPSCRAYGIERLVERRKRIGHGRPYESSFCLIADAEISRELDCQGRYRGRRAPPPRLALANERPASLAEALCAGRIGFG